MKDQYFGDARDYFKYDVLETLLAADRSLEQASCIWMLTPPDATGQGRVPFVPDPELPELTQFFLDRQDAAHRRVREMPIYLGRHGHHVYSHMDDRDDFSTRNRQAYFESIPDAALQHSVVFFDPDNGVEPAGRVSEKHVLFAELAEAYRRMDTSSILVVFQYFRRVPDFWGQMAFQFSQRLESECLFVAEPAVGFYVVPKDSSYCQTVRVALLSVATRHTPMGRGHRRVGGSAPRTA